MVWLSDNRWYFPLSGTSSVNSSCDRESNYFWKWALNA